MMTQSQTEEAPEYRLLQLRGLRDGYTEAAEVYQRRVDDRLQKVAAINEEIAVLESTATPGPDPNSFEVAR